jgi:hypothetical protein
VPAPVINDNGGAPHSQPDVAQPADAAVNPSPQPLPSNWFTNEGQVAGWVGKPWREVELFQLMPRWPRDLDTGKRFVVFYSRTCEHCQAMFSEDLSRPLAAPVTAIEIPDSRTQMTSSSAWPMPQTTVNVELMSLPLGPLWLITPPLAITIENGIVTCAEETSHKKCFGLE